MPSVCACGCGQTLPDGSARRYKRGHRNPSPPIDTDTPVTMTDDDWTIDDIAGQIPDDPDPAPAGAKPAEIPIRVTKRVKDDIEGKVGLLLTLIAQGWVIRDQYCGMVFLNQAPIIAEKMVPVICKSPELVKWLTKGGNVAIWGDLFVAMLPVLQAIFAHHLARTVEQPEPLDPSLFTAS